MNDKKDILYILLTVGMLGIVGFYLAYTRGQSIGSIITIPFQQNTVVTTVPENDVTEESQDRSDDLKGGNYFARVSTNLGEIEIDLLENNAPNSVKNFVYLSESGYYDGTSFHRFIPNLIIQGGSRNTLTPDKSDDKLGNPGYVIDDEINWNSIDISEEKKTILRDAGYSSNEKVESVKVDKYVLAWASSAPNTNGSQFFIVLGNRDDQKIIDLEGKHTVFGRVVKGQEIIDEISKMPINLENLEEPRPEKDIRINTVTIEKR